MTARRDTLIWVNHRRCCPSRVVTLTAVSAARTRARDVEGATNIQRKALVFTCFAVHCDNFFKKMSPRNTAPCRSTRTCRNIKHLLIQPQNHLIQLSVHNPLVDQTGVSFSSARCFFRGQRLVHRRVKGKKKQNKDEG